MFLAAQSNVSLVWMSSFADGWHAALNSPKLALSCSAGQGRLDLAAAKCLITIYLFKTCARISHCQASCFFDIDVVFRKQSLLATAKGRRHLECRSPFQELIWSSFSNCVHPEWCTFESMMPQRWRSHPDTEKSEGSSLWEVRVNRFKMPPHHCNNYMPGGGIAGLLGI